MTSTSTGSSARSEWSWSERRTPSANPTPRCGARCARGARPAAPRSSPSTRTARRIDGLPCASSIHDIDGDIDLVAILVGDVLPAMQDVIDRKVAFAVVFAAGFSEVGKEGENAAGPARGDDRGGRHPRARSEHQPQRLRGLQRGRCPASGSRSITQSGHQGRPIYQAHEELGIAMSHWAPTGNEADLEFADFVRYFADQPDVGVIAAYIEGLQGRPHADAGRRPRGQAARAARLREGGPYRRGPVDGQGAHRPPHRRRRRRQRRVPPVRHHARRRPRRAHRDVGAARARRSRQGDGVCIYAISGGTGAHMADLAADAGLRLPELTKKSQKALHEWIPGYLRVSNPVDNGGAPSGDWRGRKILDAIVADPNVDLVICPITGALPSMANQLCQDLADVSELTDKPICVIWGSPTYDSDAYKVLARRAEPDRVPHVRQLRTRGEGVLRLPRVPSALPVAQLRGQALAPAAGQGRARRVPVEAAARRVRHHRVARHPLHVAGRGGPGRGGDRLSRWSSRRVRRRCCTRRATAW